MSKTAAEPEEFVGPQPKIEYLSTESLKLWEGNPRLNEPAVPEVMRSIKEYGFIVPVVIGKDMVVKAGNTRLKAARKLGLKRIPVVRAEHLTEEQLLKFALADNRTAEIATWDLKQVTRLFNLKDIKEIPGFNKKDIDRINVFLLKESGTVQEEKGPGLRPASEVKVKLGEIYQLGDHLLACGDCTDKRLVSKLLGDFKPNLMVTDPPYGVDYDPDWRNHAKRQDGTALGASSLGTVKNDTRSDWSEAWALFEGDVAYVWHAGKYASIVQATLERSGLEIKSQIIWKKNRFAISRSNYHWIHEPCWYAVRKGKPSAWNGDRTQTTVWEINNFNAFGQPNAEENEKTDHSTQKPIECMAKPILNNSQLGDYIYDPFVGSGTTIIAAEKLGRRCLSIEIDPAYVQMSIDRWEKITGKTATRI